MYIKTLRFVVILIAFPTLASTSYSEEQWTGRRFMARANARIMNGSEEVPMSTVSLPLLVSAENGEWLEIDQSSIKTGQGSIKKSDVIALREATSYFADYLRSHPKSSWAYSQRGRALAHQGDLDKAIQDFNTAIELDQNRFTNYVYRGLAWASKGNKTLAIRDFTEAIASEPNHPAGYHNRGVAWAQMGNYEDALKDFTKAIRLDPENAASYNGRAWIRATAPDSKFRDGNLAIEDATKACELTEWKQYPDINTLAAAFAEAGDFERAIEYLEKSRVLTKVRSQQDSYRTMIELFRAGKPYRDNKRE